MARTAEEDAQLAALREARRKLISGEMVAKVTSGGRTVEYAKGDLADIKGEIAELEAIGTTTGRRRGPIRFFIR